MKTVLVKEVEYNEEIDNYIYKVAMQIRRKINIFQKVFLFLTPNSEIHHWGFCLYIRNNYIYNDEKLMNLNIDPDELSDIILKRVVKPRKK